MNRQLQKQIEQAVKHFSLDDDGQEFDSLSDFEIAKLSRGVYSVTGYTIGTVCSPSRDSGNYYEPPVWDEYEVEAYVVLTVYTHRNGYEADVELESIDYNKEPWEKD